MFVNNDFTSSLQYSIMNDVRFTLHMYVREECDHELLTILNKCLKRMPEDILNQLIAEYTSYTPRNLTFAQYIQANPQTTVLLVMGIILVSVIILILILRVRWKEKILQASEKANKELEDQFCYCRCTEP